MVVGEGDNHIFSLAPYISQMNTPKKFDNTLVTWDYIYINFIDFYARK